MEDFANEVQIIDLKPDEVEEIKDTQPIADILPGVTPATVPAAVPICPASIPSVPFSPVLPVVLHLVFRLCAISALRYALTVPAANIGCSRRGSIHIRGDTSRTTI